MSTLGERDVQVWLTEAPEDASAERIARCAALLADDERTRMGRFRNVADQRRYLFAHALVRATLSRHAPDTPPERWRFVTNAQGRPEIAPEPGGARLTPPLRFNLSHTAGLVACAVTRGRDVGVDVEHLHPPSFDAEACLEIAASHFAPAEVAGLRAQAPEARRARFFAIWTLKEAYLKARGLGLALPLERFAFELDARAPAIGVHFAPDLDDDAAAWHFARLAPTAAHALAVAARRAPGETLTVSVCRASPESP